MSLVKFVKPEKIVFNKATDFHALFDFYPLEPGYGVTIGNSLRRVLLGSLEGYAISGIKINGVEHEFSTIKGVTEDVTDIILNLKQIRLKKVADIDITSDHLILSIRNKTEFKAHMLEEVTSSFKVVNPDLTICRMTSDTKLDIELYVTQGRGYVVAEEQKNKDNVLGYIPIDAIYTPMKNVKYSIENTRVDQRTDYEKLTFEIETDGTIHPEEAIKKASSILIKHLMIITDDSLTFDIREEKKSNIVDEKTLLLRKVLKTPLEDLDLSVRAFNCLKAAKINSLSELVQFKQDDLMKFRNFGQKSLTEIEQVLRERGLSFGMDLSKLMADR